ncbi:sugar phosphate nucleotidyltransferase, partial [Streptomyces sp. AC627_RSS907]
MIGLVLAAGAGRRLRPYTDTLPKALVPVDPAGEGTTTVLDLTLGNFAEVGLTDVAIVVGYRKEAVYERKEALERKYGVRLTLIDNDKAEEWNNAYSLWCAREVLKQGAILANGDTVHPVSVEKSLLAARGKGQKIILALDTVKQLADEEMKVVTDPAKG